MVRSRLHTKIEYPESKRMDAEDKQYKSVIYQCNILPDNILYRITLGKERDNFSHFGVYYYPIYLVSDKNKIRGKIGVYEIESTKRLTITDDDGDVNIDLLGSPTLFLHVTKEYLQKYGFRTIDPNAETFEEGEIDEGTIDVPTKDKKEKNNEEEDDEKEEEEEEEEDQDNIFDLSVPQKQKPKSIDDETKITRDNVFSKMDVQLPDTYAEETKTIAKKIRSQYTKNSSDSWIVQALENPNYRIKKIPGDGDCFFTSVVEAYKSIGLETTVPKLRAMLSQEVHIAQVEEYRKIYMDLMKEKNNLDIELKKKELALSDLKRSKSNPSLSLENARKIVELSKSNQEEKESLTEQQEMNELNIKDFAFMKTILYDMNEGDNDSRTILDKFKLYVQTSDYWADTWAISTLERLLNMKVIIMEDTTDKNAIMRCTQMNDDVSKYKDYDPTHYVILNYTMNGNHYELITYQSKAIFTFTEIPYDLKELVVRRCLEKMAGPFALIPAFRQFRYDLGLLEAEDEDEDDYASSEENKKLYDELPVLQFYERSASSKPGKGNGDETKEKGLKEDPYFADLNRFLKGTNPKEKKEREEWRRMLDDSWTKYQFEVDNKKWASVEHYLKAVPFKDRYPAIYHNFSISDSTSDISTDLKKAEDSMKSIKGKEGVHYKAKKDVKDLDPDLEKEYRTDALRSKFTQNADLTTLLASTKMSKLQKYIPKNPSKIDVELMKIRQEILNGKTNK
jgi:hypothetical protein